MYILAVCPDVSEKDVHVERWFRPSIEELYDDCFEPGWMEEHEYHIYSCIWNQEAEWLGNSFDGLSPNLPPFADEYPENIGYCYDCEIFYDKHPTMCRECGCECECIDP